MLEHTRLGRRQTACLAPDTGNEDMQMKFRPPRPSSTRWIERLGVILSVCLLALSAVQLGCALFFGQIYRGHAQSPWVERLEHPLGFILHSAMWVVLFFFFLWLLLATVRQRRRSHAPSDGDAELPNHSFRSLDEGGR